jgi:hypothetical protein
MSSLRRQPRDSSQLLPAQNIPPETQLKSSPSSHPPTVPLHLPSRSGDPVDSISSRVHDPYQCHLLRPSCLDRPRLPIPSVAFHRKSVSSIGPAASLDTSVEWRHEHGASSTPAAQLAAESLICPSNFPSARLAVPELRPCCSYRVTMGVLSWNRHSRVLLNDGAGVKYP